MLASLSTQLFNLLRSKKKFVLFFGGSSRACMTLSWKLIPCLHGSVSAVHDKQVTSIESCLTHPRYWLERSISKTKISAYACDTVRYMHTTFVVYRI